jgi:hypothetical protein
MAKKHKNKDVLEEMSDIFMESAIQSLADTAENLTVTVIDENIKDRPINDQNIGQLYSPVRKTFEDLKIAMDEEHAERFNKILSILPDREFVRVYLKTLEFFKPKVIRQMGDQERGDDTTINVIIKR